VSIPIASGEAAYNCSARGSLGTLRISAFEIHGRPELAQDEIQGFGVGGRLAQLVDKGLQPFLSALA
jgi:hypothetical protein